MKSKLTKEIEKSLQKETINLFGCLEVTIGWSGNKRVDFMTMDSKEVFRCFEIKISKEDFHSKHGHNFVGHFNYYVMPIELFEDVKDKVPKYIGVYTWSGSYLELVKRAKKQVVEGVDILKNSLIRSLYRETSKIKNSENIELMNKLKNRVVKLEKENAKDKIEYQLYRCAIREELGSIKFKEFKEKFNL